MQEALLLLCKELKKKRIELGMIAVALFLGTCAVIAEQQSFFTASNAVGNRELPVYCVDTTENKVAISFDAAWGNEDTGKLMEILAKHKVHATFFMTGGWVESYPEDVKKLYKEGHELGNHSENHKNMSQLSLSEMKEEIMKVHDKVKNLTGYDMVSFRPPYGDYNNDVVKVAKACGYQAIQWDVDSLDWKDYGVDDIVKRVCEHKHLGKGSIILMHNGAKYTADALDNVLTKLEEAGYKLVPVRELVYVKDYHIDHEGRQFHDQ